MKVALPFAATALILVSTAVLGDDLDRKIAPAAFDPANAAPTETVVLAGGCFWGQQGRVRTCQRRDAKWWPAIPAAPRKPPPIRR